MTIDVRKKLEKGLEHQRDGRLEEAESCYGDVLQLEPENGDALKLLATVAFKRGRFQDAASYAASATASHPSVGEYWHLLGRAHLACGNPDAAEIALRNAIDRNSPMRAKARLDLIACLRRRKAWKDALALAQDVLKEQPDDELALHAAADASVELQEDRPALDYLDRILAIKPTDASVWHASAPVVARLGDHGSAYTRATKASTLDPENREYAYLRRVAASKIVPIWHFSMMNDRSRNFVYAEGAACKIRPGQLVLEIGTGSGLLAMLAAKAGASRVVACEGNALLAGAAKEVIAANHLSHIITVVPKMSTDLVVGVDLPERADVLISEIFASWVIEEGVLDTLEDARARLLKPGATIIPGRAAACGALIVSEVVARGVRVDRVCGFDLSAMNDFAPLNIVVSPGREDIRWLSDPVDLFNFDFQESASFPNRRREVEIGVTSTGLCHGLIQWMRIDFDGAVSYENKPGTCDAYTAGHWSPIFFAFPEPVQLVVGQRVLLEVLHNRDTLRVDLLDVQ